MKCPYCNEDMRKGVIQSQNEINWKPKKANFFVSSDFHEGAIVLSQFSFLKGSCVAAYCCKDCKKVIIDYKQSNPTE